MNEIWFNDTPDKIQQCLNCTRKECINCLNRSKSTKPSPGVRKPVIMCDRNTGEPIERFPSINEAARTLDICHTGILYALKGRYKTAGGFIWKPDNDEEET